MAKSGPKNGKDAKSRPVLSGALLWRTGPWVMASLCLIVAVFIWMSGTGETKEALDNGRRLMIRLDTSAIEGKQVLLDNAESPPESKTEPKPEAKRESPPESPHSSPAESKAEAKPESVAESPSAAPIAASPESVQASPTASESPDAARTSGNTSIQASAPSMIDDTSTIKPAAVPLAEVNEALLERTTAGALPIIGPKGMKPWLHYAKPYRHKGNLPTIAILVTGLGQNKTVSEGAIRLPENISLSFSPYAKDLISWTNAARIAGHEILIDLPLEPSNYPASDPGPYGLLTGKGPEENAKRMQWLMSRIPGYTGFVTPQNESFSGSDASFKDLLEQLTSRGVMVVMEHEPAKDETKKILDASGIAYSIADVRLDEELSASAIQARLATLEKMASKRGYAVGIAQAFPLTILQLSAWSAELEKNGYTLVPITFITKLKFPS